MSTVDISTAAQIARLTARQNAALAVLDELETAGPAVQRFLRADADTRRLFMFMGNAHEHFMYGTRTADEIRIEICRVFDERIKALIALQ
jgi:hypothetical protein